LLREGKSIINIAHGIGIYNPYNLYTKFELINNLQKSFYKNFDQKIEFLKNILSLKKLLMRNLKQFLYLFIRLIYLNSTYYMKKNFKKRFYQN